MPMERKTPDLHALHTVLYLNIIHGVYIKEPIHKFKKNESNIDKSVDILTHMANNTNLPVYKLLKISSVTSK